MHQIYGTTTHIEATVASWLENVPCTYTVRFKAGSASLTAPTFNRTRIFWSTWRLYLLLLAGSSCIKVHPSLFCDSLGFPGVPLK